MDGASKPDAAHVPQENVGRELEGPDVEREVSSSPSLGVEDPVPLDRKEDLNPVDDEPIQDNFTSGELQSTSALESPSGSRDSAEDVEPDTQELEEQDIGPSDVHPRFIPKGKFNPPSSGPKKPKPKPPKPKPTGDSSPRKDAAAPSPKKD